MDEERFDLWVRRLGDRMSRRGALTVVAAALVALPRDGGAARRRRANRGEVAAQRNAECAARCKNLFPPGKKRGECISDGARGRGPCAKPPCARRCATDGRCCDDPGFGCCDGTCIRLGHDGACPPPVCTPPSSCTEDAQCCGTDVCQCGSPRVCVEFGSLGTGACCKSGDECQQQCVQTSAEPFGVCCDPRFPETCVCQNCPA